MKPGSLVHIDISAHVRGMGIIRRFDVYSANFWMVMALYLLVATMIEGSVWYWVALAVFLPIAAYCFFIAFRKIGTLSSLTWTHGVRALWIAFVPCAIIFGLLLFCWGMGTVDRLALIQSLPLYGGAAVWILGVLFTISRLRSLRLPTLGITLEGLAKVRPERDTMLANVSAATQVSPGNLLRALAFGSIGLATLLAQAVLTHLALTAMEEGHPDALMWQALLPYAQFALNLVGVALFLRSRRYLQLDADTALRTDSRAPVLYLRSFEDEQKPRWTEFSSALFDYSLETRLNQHFLHFGPFIAVGSPEESLPSLGAARVRLSNDEWQARVRGWMHSSQAIVVIVGRTYWVTWELASLTRMGLLKKSILIFVQDRGFARASVKRRRKRERVRNLKVALRGTPWEAASNALEAEPELRALSFGEDGSIAAIRSKSGSRDAYHLATAVAHHLTRIQRQLFVLRLKAAGQTRQWTITSSVTRLGASALNDVVLSADKFASSEHAQIECRGTKISIVDLHSKNGTFVNGTALSDAPRALSDGDEIQVGQSKFELRVGAG